MTKTNDIAGQAASFLCQPSCYGPGIDGLQSTPSWLTFETHGNHKVSIHYF